MSLVALVAKLRRGVFAMVLALPALGGAEGCSSPSTASASDQPVTTPAPAAAPEPPKAPSPLEVMLQQDTLYQALVLSRADMADTVDDGPSKGAWLFAFWLGHKGHWFDVAVSTDETTVKRAKKDIETARAKRLCVRGSIIQIKRDSSPQLSVWVGNMMTDGFNVVNYIATGETGDLVEGSRARLCGVVTGQYSFANVSGGQTQSLQVVGMFDLPENRH